VTGAPSPANRRTEARARIGSRHSIGFAASIALLAALAALSACRKKPPPAPPPPLVAVAHPLKQDVVDWDDFVGRFEAVNAVDVRPRVTGYLQAIRFKDGDIVRKGQVLFEIDPRPYQAALDQARGVEAHDKAALADATLERKRAEGLFAAHAVSRQELDNRIAAEQTAQADLATASANVRNAELNLGWTRVIAPLTGRASDRKFAPGNLVTADTTILTNIVDLDPIRFSFVGPESVYLKYERANLAGTRISSRQMANPVVIRLQDETSYRWRGHMDFVDNQLDTQSGTIRGRAVVDNPDYFLAPGLFGHLRLLGSGAFPALLVPDTAVVTDQTRLLVYVVDGGGVVRERLVATGSLLGNLRIIRSGLKVEDTVVIDGMQRVHPGEKVRTRIEQIPPSSFSPHEVAETIEPSASVALPAHSSRRGGAE
jgi:RND family efflux transporter MFP subunit